MKHLDTLQKDSAPQVVTLDAQIACLDAALRPFATATICGQPHSFFKYLTDGMWITLGVPMGAWRKAADVFDRFHH